MYLMNIRPSRTCLYSAASMLLRSASAAAHSFASSPTDAESFFLVAFFALSSYQSFTKASAKPISRFAGHARA
jgi:hypothetical protein